MSVGIILGCIEDNWVLKDDGVLLNLGQALESGRDSYVDLEMVLK
jgi:hypothetical protein